MTQQTRPAKAGWQVYIVRCADGSLYTGITTDLIRRLQEHNSQTGAAARYTRSRQPAELVYTEQAAGRGAAAKREYAIKQLSRAQKLALISSGCGPNQAVADGSPTDTPDQQFPSNRASSSWQSKVKEQISG